MFSGEIPTERNDADGTAFVLHPFYRTLAGYVQVREGFNSVTDHLPVDLERQNWSVEALERKDKEIANYEASAKADALETCRKLSKRFAVNGGI